MKVNWFTAVTLIVVVGGAVTLAALGRVDAALVLTVLGNIASAASKQLFEAKKDVAP